MVRSPGIIEVFGEINKKEIKGSEDPGEKRHTGAKQTSGHQSAMFRGVNTTKA